MKFLTFSLAGPLCSYGETDRWDYRGTAEMPTKSAVIGLLGCCMGLPRRDKRLRRLCDVLQMAVRRDQAGTLLTDYQTVQSPTGVILNAQRKPRGSTIITPKQYLQDAVYQIFLYGDEGELAMCASALNHPRWVVGLGRSCCPPAVPIVPELFEAESVVDALRRKVDTTWLRWIWEKAMMAHKQGKNLAEQGLTNRLCESDVRCEVEYSDSFDLNVFTGAYQIVRHDAVICADENRYEDRRVIACVVRREAVCF